MSYSVLGGGEAFWRPSNQMGVLNTDLAKQLGVPKRQVSLVSGDTSRRKRVRVEGLGAAHVEAVMSGAT